MARENGHIRIRKEEELSAKKVRQGDLITIGEETFVLIEKYIANKGREVTPPQKPPLPQTPSSGLIRKEKDGFVMILTSIVNKGREQTPPQKPPLPQKPSSVHIRIAEDFSIFEDILRNSKDPKKESLLRQTVSSREAVNVRGNPMRPAY